MPEVELTLTVDIDDVHNEFLADIEEATDEDAISLLERQLSNGIGPTVEEMIYKARQQTKEQ